MDRQPSYHRCQAARKLDRLSSCGAGETWSAAGVALQTFPSTPSIEIPLPHPPVPPCVPQFVMFHGCYHDASGSWPYDPVSAQAQRSAAQRSIAHAALVDVQLQNCTT